MIRLVIPVSALLLGVALLMAGNGLLTTLIGVRLGDSDQGEFRTGLVMSGYFLGLVLGALYAHRLVEQVGHIRTFAALASLFSAASLIHAFQEQEIIWWFLRVIEGLCMAGLFLCAESWLNDTTSNANRGALLSLYTVTAGLATGVGQLLLATFTIEGFILFALSSILVSLAVVPVSLTRTPGPPVPAPSRLDLPALWRLSSLGVSSCTASGLVLGAFYGMAPTFGHQTGLDADGIAWFMGATIIGGVALLLPIGRLSDRIDRRLAILGTGIGLAGVSAALVVITVTKFAPGALEVLPIGDDGQAALTSVSGQFHRWISPLTVVFGVLLYTLYPLGVAQAIDRADSGDFVAVSGGLLLSYSVGAMFGPIAASLLMQGLGPSGLFLFSAAVGGLLGLYAIWRMKTTPIVPLGEQAPFQPVPRTTVAAYDMDPRQEKDQLILEPGAAPPGQ